MCLSRECVVLEQAHPIHGGGHEASRFKGEEGIVVGRHSTFLSGRSTGSLQVRYSTESKETTLHYEKGDTIDLQVSFNIAASTFLLCVYFIGYSTVPLLKCTSSYCRYGCLPLED
jgi:hypothetical protein